MGILLELLMAKMLVSVLGHYFCMLVGLSDDDKHHRLCHLWNEISLQQLAMMLVVVLVFLQRMLVTTKAKHLGEMSETN